MARNKAVIEHIAQQKALRDAQDRAKEEGKSVNDFKALSAYFDDPIEFLESVMNQDTLPVDTRLRAAVAMLPYKHGKQKTTSAKPRLSKGQQTKLDAENANSGIFGTIEGGYMQ